MMIEEDGGSITRRTKIETNNHIYTHLWAVVVQGGDKAKQESTYDLFSPIQTILIYYYKYSIK